MILEDAVKQFALPTMTCPVTGDLSPTAYYTYSTWYYCYCDEMMLLVVARKSPSRIRVIVGSLCALGSGQSVSRWLKPSRKGWIPIFLCCGN